MNKFIIILILATTKVFSGAFIFAGEDNGVDLIAHPKGYTGSGTVLNVSVCIDPASSVTTQLVIPVKNIINTWNHLATSSPNLFFGGDNNIGSSEVDWESVTLHEVGHCIGLSHPNLGSVDGVTGANTNLTQTTDGANGSFSLLAGPDGIEGSSDDVRGDDINLHWFNIGVNNPFEASSPYDASNYSRLLGDLPVGDSFPANADFDVGNTLGFSNTEAVMQQGTSSDEDQRKLGVDDVATIKLGMSGLDMIQGNSDDYTINLTYGGISNGSGCDINIKHDPTYMGLGICTVGGIFVSGTHVAITDADIRIGAGFNWFYNTLENDIIFQNGFE